MKERTQNWNFAKELFILLALPNCAALI